MYLYHQSFLYVVLFLMFYIECSSFIRKADGDVIVGEKGKDITLKWKMFNIAEKHNLEFFVNKIDKANSLGSVFTVYNKSIPLTITRRISSGSCYFPGSNGTCNITLSNLKYNDSGVYIAAEYVGPILNMHMNVSLMVKGNINPSTSTTTATKITTLAPTKTIPATITSATPSTTSTTNVTRNIPNTPNQCSCTKTMEIIGALIGGLVFGIVLTTIAFVIWLRKGKKKENVNQNELKERQNNNAANDITLKNDHTIAKDVEDTYSMLTTPFDAEASTYTDLAKDRMSSERDNDIISQDYEVMED